MQIDEEARTLSVVYVFQSLNVLLASDENERTFCPIANVRCLWLKCVKFAITGHQSKGSYDSTDAAVIFIRIHRVWMLRTVRRTSPIVQLHHPTLHWSTKRWQPVWKICLLFPFYFMPLYFTAIVLQRTIGLSSIIHRPDPKSHNLLSCSAKSSFIVPLRQSHHLLSCLRKAVFIVLLMQGHDFYVLLVKAVIYCPVRQNHHLLSRSGKAIIHCPARAKPSFNLNFEFWILILNFNFNFDLNLMIAYIALFSALLSTLTALACGSTWVTSFIARFFNIHRSGVLTALAWLVPHETAAVSAQVLCTPYNNAPCHFMQSHIRKVYACLAVTCHLHFWQNNRDLLRAAAVTRGWNGYRNKSQHRKSTLEKKIIPPLQQGFEPAKFQSRVRRSNHWAISAPYCPAGQRCNFRPWLCEWIGMHVASSRETWAGDNSLRDIANHSFHFMPHMWSVL